LRITNMIIKTVVKKAAVVILVRLLIIWILDITPFYVLQKPIWRERKQKTKIYCKNFYLWIGSLWIPVFQYSSEGCLNNLIFI
jgi:hypothetical protein